MVVVSVGPKIADEAYPVLSDSVTALAHGFMWGWWLRVLGLEYNMLFLLLQFFCLLLPL